MKSYDDIEDFGIMREAINILKRDESKKLVSEGK